MSLYSACIALLGGVATLGGISAANAGCWAPIADECAAAYVAPPIWVAQPIPRPIYVVNQGIYIFVHEHEIYPYVHGHEFYRRPDYYYGGSHGGWLYARRYGAGHHRPLDPMEK